MSFTCIVECPLAVFIHIQTHLFGLAAGHFFDSIHPFSGSGDVEYGLQLVQGFFRNLAEHSRTIVVEVASETLVDFVEVFTYPFADGAGLGVVFVLLIDGRLERAISVVFDVDHAASTHLRTLHEFREGIELFAGVFRATLGADTDN